MLLEIKNKIVRRHILYTIKLIIKQINVHSTIAAKGVLKLQLLN